MPCACAATAAGAFKRSKTAAAPEIAGLARGEWEREIVGETPVLDEAWLAEIGDKNVRKVLGKAKVQAGLAPLFTTDFRRQAWRVRYGVSDIEMAFDKGEISAGKGSSPIAEVELELKDGDPADLYGLARDIADIVPASVEARTKAERGYALLDKKGAGKAPSAVRAAPIRLSPEVTTAEAFALIGRACFRHMRANESLMRGKPFVEGVHQLRVALRRLRSALSAFRDVLPEDERKTMSEELRWIASSCGQARDWDVFRSELLKPLAEHVEDDPALANVAAAADRARKRSYAEVTATLASPRLTPRLCSTSKRGGKKGHGARRWAAGRCCRPGSSPPPRSRSSIARSKAWASRSAISKKSNFTSFASAARSCVMRRSFSAASIPKRRRVPISKRWPGCRNIWAHLTTRSSPRR